jgi:hypothetical protein
VQSPVAQSECVADPPAAAVSPVFVEPERRYAMVCEAAYFLAERRNFCPGQELEDWLQAEREIDRALTAAAPAALIDS